MFFLECNNLKFSINEYGNAICWESLGTPLKQSENADFWRAYGDDGYEREMTVRSSKQSGRVTKNDDELVIVYDKLIADNGRVFDTSLMITIKKQFCAREGLLFGATVENRSDVRINEVQLPFIDLECACDEDKSRDVFYHANGLGAIIKSPWDTIRRTNHTEYITSDNHVIWNAMRYPGDAAMSWFGLQSGGKFLYLGRHAEELKVTVLSVGVSPRLESDRLMMAISHLPFAKKGESVTVSECFVSLSDGTWESGSDIYGTYARAHWYSEPNIPEWVKIITGWQRIILRHQFGEVNFKYEDLPMIYETGKKYGLNMLMVFGWWKGRFDNGYPIYEPDDALGGAEKLKEAIARVRKMGGYVALYTNGQLIDVNTDYYREVGHKICRIDIDGNDYRDHYRFGNDGLVLRSFGYKSFVTACAATEEWQNRVVMHEKMKFDYGCDSAFFDQLGAAAPLPCFNEEHLHGSRPDEVERWRVEAFKRLAENCPEGKAIGTEMVNDMVLPYVQYIHGCQIGTIFTPNCFPEMFIRTFPEIVQTDRFIHDDNDSTDRRLAHAFIRGFRLDICPWRGRTHIGQLPSLAEKVGKLLSLKEEYRRFFYDGRIAFETKLSVPSCIRYGEFVDGDERIFALWNDSATAISFELFGKEYTLNPQGYCVAKQ